MAADNAKQSEGTRPFSQRWCNVGATLGDSILRDTRRPRVIYVADVRCIRLAEAVLLNPSSPATYKFSRCCIRRGREDEEEVLKKNRHEKRQQRAQSLQMRRSSRTKREKKGARNIYTLFQDAIGKKKQTRKNIPPSPISIRKIDCIGALKNKTKPKARKGLASRIELLACE